VKIKIMNTKTKALTLLSVMVVAAVAGSFILLQSTVTANNYAVAADTEQALSSVNATDTGPGGFNGQGGFAMEPRFGMGGHRGGPGGGGFGRGFGGGTIQVSSEYIQNVTNIANSDSDVQNLLSQGFNITYVHPNISTVVDGNGNVVTKASTADLMLIGNNGSRAHVAVDLTQEKVTKIVTMTITEINK
jgi:hypothetical protein